MRSISSSGARSCRVTTTEPAPPSPAGTGVTLTKARTLRPSGTDSTTSSARTVSGLANCVASGISASEVSVPSARRQETTSRSCSVGCPGVRRASTMRRASRLSDKRLAGAGAEAHDSHRRGLDQRLEVGPGAALGAVRSGVGDCGSGLDGEHRQHRLVGVVKLAPVGLLGEEEDAGVDATVAHRHALEGAEERRRGFHTEFPDVGGEVCEAQGVSAARADDRRNARCPARRRGAAPRRARSRRSGSRPAHRPRRRRR